jgi:hypothetical protein
MDIRPTDEHREPLAARIDSAASPRLPSAQVVLPLDNLTKEIFRRLEVRVDVRPVSHVPTKYDFDRSEIVKFGTNFALQLLQGDVAEGHPRSYRLFVTTATLELLSASKEIGTALTAMVFRPEERKALLDDVEAGEVLKQLFATKQSGIEGREHSDSVRFGVHILFLDRDVATFPGNLVKMHGTKALDIDSFLNESQRAFITAIADRTQAKEFITNLVWPVSVVYNGEPHLAFLRKNADPYAIFYPRVSGIPAALPRSSYEMEGLTSAINRLLKAHEGLAEELRLGSEASYVLKDAAPLARAHAGESAPRLTSEVIPQSGTVTFAVPRASGTSTERALPREDVFLVESWYGEGGDKNLRGALKSQSRYGDENSESHVSELGRILSVTQSKNGAEVFMGDRGLLMFYLPPGGSVSFIASSYGTFHQQGHNDGMAWGVTASRGADGKVTYASYDSGKHIRAINGDGNHHNHFYETTLP